MSRAMEFKEMVVEKVLEGIIKDIPIVDPTTESINRLRLHKVINGAYAMEGKETSYRVLTKNFMDALRDTYVAIEYYKELVSGIRIADKPTYEESLDPVTHDIKRKIRLVFLLPDKEEKETEAAHD